MSDWPRFQLTREEAQYASKYEDPRTNKQMVLRRMYYNELNISTSLRKDSIQFQISRRARVFGITAAGDIWQFKVELVDSTGEQYTAGVVHLANLLKGWAPDPLDVGGINVIAPPAFYTLIPTVREDGPFIMEPSIVLAPNQSLNLNAYPADPNDVDNDFRIGVTFHVWEFPGMPGSPL